LPDGPGGVDLAALLRKLAERGVLEVLCEAGGKLSGALFNAGLVDKVMVIVGTKLVGGRGPAAWDGPGRPSMAEALDVVDSTMAQADEDIIITGYVQRSA
jgi:diaminohydroxyphosphoribosylaminopyrimidine deaminase/5-amino-6-(5-phosphoribosylamino)uracil reductase